jgi:hypothetical protein
MFGASYNVLEAGVTLQHNAPAEAVAAEVTRQ